MREMFPALDLRKDILFVHDGNTITSTGGVKSFEAVLYLYEYLYDAEIVRGLSEGLVIDWNFEKVSNLIIQN